MSNSNYEELLQELNGVINKLSQDNTGLDESVALFTQGINLIGQCRKQLDDASEKVNILIRQHNGELTKAPSSIGQPDQSAY